MLAIRLFIILLLIPISTSAEEILNFDVTVHVQESGSLEVSENIEYDFGKDQRHGIYRDIPYQVVYQFSYADIGLSRFRVMMDDKAVSWNEESVGGDAGPMLRLKIGDADRTISGIHSYSIVYRVEHGVLAADGGEDAIRWNVTGTGWKVPIRYASAIVHLPSQLSQQVVRESTYSGKYGERGTTAGSEWQDDRTFVTNVTALGSHQGLTFELAYPAGLLGQTAQYSTSAWIANWLRTFWHWLVFLAGAAGMLRYWWIKGRDPKTGPVPVSYDPPKGLDAAQVGLLRDQSVDRADIGAAVLELARDGYLSIESTSETVFGAAVDKITLRSKREAGIELPDYKRQLLNGLFKDAASLELAESVPRSRAEQIQQDIKKTKELLYDWSVKEGLMRENPKKVRYRSMLLGTLAMLPLIGVGLYDTFPPYLGVVFVLLGMVVFLIPGIVLIGIGSGCLVRGIGIFWIVICLGFFFLMLKEFGLFEHAELLLKIPALSLLLLLAFVLWLGWHMPARTELGTRLYARILGYREFMLRVDQQLLSRQLEKDPLYLDKTLPYAVALEVVDQWMSHFEAMHVAPPQWYTGEVYAISRVSSSIGAVASIGPPSSSGGSSGGGGFSGGGGGGGGGGSW